MIQATYSTPDGGTVVRPRRGGRESTINLGLNEYIVSVYGVTPTSGSKANREHRLNIKPSSGRSFSFGRDSAENFRFEGRNIIGFFDCSGRELDAIGVIAINN